MLNQQQQQHVQNEAEGDRKVSSNQSGRQIHKHSTIQLQWWDINKTQKQGLMLHKAKEPVFLVVMHNKTEKYAQPLSRHRQPTPYTVPSTPSIAPRLYDTTQSVFRGDAHMLTYTCGVHLRRSSFVPYPTSLPLSRSENRIAVSREPLANITPRRIVLRQEFVSGCFLGLTVCLALFPVARSVSEVMDGSRTSQSSLVRYLKRSLRISSPRVERALLDVDRKYFVDPSLPDYVVYKDIPLPIGFDETISAPHMHATCLELLQHHLTEHARILDVGSGSGYLTASLALMAGEGSFVLGVEKHRELAEQSIVNIRNSNPELLMARPPRVRIMAGNALSEILNEEESFDAIHVGAAASTLPKNLVEKLSPGGRMVVPVGPRSAFQELMCIDKDQEGTVTTQSLMQVRYVPLTKPSEGSESVPVN